MRTNGKIASPGRADKPAEPNEADTARLARLIATYAPHDGSFELRIPVFTPVALPVQVRIAFTTFGCPACASLPNERRPSSWGREVYEYDASRTLVFSVALPIASQVTQASHSAAYLGFRSDLDPHKIAELVLKVFPQGLPLVQERRAVYVAPVDECIINAAVRLLECLAQFGDVELLAPLVVEEILIRLLRSPIGARVAQMGFAESSVHRIAKAISWLRDNFSQPIKIEDLARMVHMSVSSFHEHFKSVTSMSPLHYQKVLRLQAARRLMLSTMLDAGSASQRVGYLSASQFSREYSRFFGSAPARDIGRLRQDARVWA